MSERVLLTGGTGLIGRGAVKALKQAGFHVVALSRGGDVAGADETLRGDLLDPVSRGAALKQAQATHLVHLAWHDAPKDRWNAPENLDWAAATLQLCREFAALGGKRAVLVGSCAEYDWSQPVLGEDTPLNPASLYGQAKAATGTFMVQAAESLGLSLAWARVFFCYGPGEQKGRLLGDLIDGLSRGEPVPCTDGLQERDFLHSDDIARALALILRSDMQGPVNVASGIATPVRDLICTTARLIRRTDLVRLGQIPRAANDPARIVADIEKLRTLGFQPAYDLGSGIHDCLVQAGVK